MGNIQIGDNVKNYTNDFNFDHNIVEFSYFLPDGEERLAYNVDDVLTIATLLNGEIISLGCNEKYKGKYKNKLYAGITMGELISLTGTQRILNGTLIVDDDYGISFILPSPYDEIADYVKDIPLDLRLNEIYVSDNSF